MQTRECLKKKTKPFVAADYFSFVLPFCRALRTPQRRPWRPVSVEWSGWSVVFWASWDPSRHPPSPGLLCLSLAWCPAPHRRFSLQKETFLCMISTSLNWLHPFSRWQSADKYIFALPYSRRFTHHKCIIKGDTCVFDTLLSICYKRKGPHVRLDLQKSMALAWRAQWNMYICHWTGHYVTRNLLLSALSDLH